MISVEDLLAAGKQALGGMRRFNGTSRTSRVRSLSIAIAICALPIAAVPAVAQGECSNEQLRENPRVSNLDPATAKPYDAGLPDCRAYEQVSPTEKDGGSGGVFNFDSPGQYAGAGDHPMQSPPTESSITYGGEAFYQIPPDEKEHVGVQGSPGQQYTFEQQYTSVRSTNGWNTEHGDTLNPEQVAPLALPPGSHAENAEESPSGAEVFYVEAGTLYEYKPSSDVVPNPANLTPIGAGVQGLLGNGGEGAEEGSYVYFVAAGALAPGAVSGTCEPETISHNKTKGTGCKLYMYHDGAITFIATLSSLDEQGGTLGSTAEDWSGPSQRTAEVSPNGRYVAFDSNYELNREGTLGGVKEFPGGAEIFRYSAESGELTCVSCLSPTPSEPDGHPLPGMALNLVSTQEAPNGANGQRYTLNNGRVLFDTPNRLAPQDIDEQPNVYEWDPVGIGSCTTSSEQFRALSNGCVGLISGGTSKVSESTLADASGNGSDVFFTTSQSLVPQDQDEITDLYDAREGGGFPPPPEAACAVESACPGPIGAPPSLGGAPASATLSGTESLPPSPKEPPIPTKAQELAKALKACHGERSRKKRAACEVSAHKRYGTTHKKKPKRKPRR
jgi:hypothetical protein